MSCQTCHDNFLQITFYQDFSIQDVIAENVHYLRKKREKKLTYTEILEVQLNSNIFVNG